MELRNLMPGVRQVERFNGEVAQGKAAADNVRPKSENLTNFEVSISPPCLVRSIVFALPRLLMNGNETVELGWAWAGKK
jgi:hypothetical protein